MPSNRAGNVSKAATISIPLTLKAQQLSRRLVYRILPLRRYGQPTLAIWELKRYSGEASPKSRIRPTKAGAILQNAIIPFGVEGGTRSSAADNIITYKTDNTLGRGDTYQSV